MSIDIKISLFSTWEGWMNTFFIWAAKEPWTFLYYVLLCLSPFFLISALLSYKLSKAIEKQEKKTARRRSPRKHPKSDWKSAKNWKRWWNNSISSFSLQIIKTTYYHFDLIYITSHVQMDLNHFISWNNYLNESFIEYEKNWWL